MTETIERWKTVLLPKEGTALDSLFTPQLFITEFAYGESSEEPTLAILTTPTFHYGGVSTGILSYYVPADDLEKLFDIHDKTIQELQDDFWNSRPDYSDVKLDLNPDEVEQFKLALEEQYDLAVKSTEHVHVYDDLFELYKTHFLKDASREDLVSTIRRYGIEGEDLQADLSQDAAVFSLGDHWVYCAEYEDIIERGETF